MRDYDYDYDRNYNKSVSDLRSRGYRVDSNGFYEPPEDKPWMQGGYVDEDGRVHQDM